MTIEAVLYVLAGIGVVALAYHFGGKKYAISAAISVLGILYLMFGRQNDWTDAWNQADEKLKEKDKDKKKKKEKVEKEKEKTEDDIKDSKKRADEIRDEIDDVEDVVKEPDDSADELKDWVEGFSNE